MQIAPYTSMTTKARREDIDRQVENGHFARLERESSTQGNIFTRFKRALMQIIAHDGAVQSIRNLEVRERLT